MDYMVDLVYKNGATQATIERRVHLCRMVAGTQLMNQVNHCDVRVQCRLRSLPKTAKFAV
ncbi:hypothetical protein ANCCAN_03329, partial [Ancylostoma caninum]